MKTVDSLPTPALLVERARLEANIETMQRRADAIGAKLRPHTKTHKSVSIARRQVAAGAGGITVAKVGEAEVFAAAGFDDIRIAYCVVGDEKMKRIAALSKRCRISFCVDTTEGVALASRTLAAEGVEIDVLVEVDTGQGRTGVPWDDAEELVAVAVAVVDSPGIRLAGVLTHGGYGYYGPREGETKEQALRRSGKAEYDRVMLAVEAIRSAGMSVDEVSVGSTPTLRYLAEADGGAPGITEVRPGNYVFHDRTQVGLGVAGWKDCALTVLTTVVSRRRDHDGTERLYLDAGKKSFTSDGAFGQDGFGQILYNARTMVPLPHADIVGLSEEHAWVHVDGGSTLEVGDVVRVVPNHACVVANNFDRMVLVDGDEVVEGWAVDARGRMT